MIEIETIYRKRYIPDECVPLKDDRILYQDNHLLITRWTTLKPRSDFKYGYSCYFLDDGCKISRFYRADNSLLYWYCDIVDYEYREADKSLIVTDLLADMIITADNTSQILDLDELVTARNRNLITEPQLLQILKHLSDLSKIVYSGRLNRYAEKLLKYSEKNNREA